MTSSWLVSLFCFPARIGPGINEEGRPEPDGEAPCSCAHSALWDLGDVTETASSEGTCASVTERGLPRSLRVLPPSQVTTPSDDSPS